MAQEEMQFRFMNSAMRVVARDGLENTTTRKIADAAELSESHIFRMFEGKDNLLRQTFNRAEITLCDMVRAALRSLQELELDHDLSSRILFRRVWAFLLGQPDLTCFYIRYYYSGFYASHAQTHLEVWNPLTEELEKHFPEEAHANIFTEHLLTLLVGSASKVIQGVLPDTEATAEQIFHLAVLSFYKGEEEPRKYEEKGTDASGAGDVAIQEW